MFGDDESDDSNMEVSVFDKFCNSAFIQIMKLRPNLKRSLDAKTDLLLPRAIGVIYCPDPHDETTHVTKFDDLIRKLKVGKFEIVETLKCPASVNADDMKNLQNETEVENKLNKLFNTASKTSFQYDVVITNNESLDIIPLLAYSITSGGLLLHPNADNHHSQATLLSTYFSNNEISESNQSNELCQWQRNYVYLNSIATPYWSPDLQKEEILLKQVTVCLSVMERKLQIFSDLTLKTSIDILKTNGVIIFKGLYRKEAVLEWGHCAIEDMTSVIIKLRDRGIDLLEEIDVNNTNNDTTTTTTTTAITKNKSDDQKPKVMIENYHEVSMREARRCDLRNGYAMKKIAKIADDQYNQLMNTSTATFADSASTNAITTTSTGTSSSSINNNDLHKIEADHDIRHHQGVIDVLTEVANIPNGEVSRGNWGRWNFEGTSNRY